MMMREIHWFLYRRCR